MKFIQSRLKPILLLLVAIPVLASCVNPRKAQQEAMAAAPALLEGDWPKVEEQMEKAISNFRGHAGFWVMLGRARYEQKKYAPAIEAFNQAIYFSKKSQRNFKAMSWQNLAKIHSVQGRYDKAIEDAKKAVNLFKEMRDRKDLILTLNLMGETYSKSGRPAKAEEVLAESLNYGGSTRLQKQVMLTHLILGDHHIKYDNPEKVVENLNKALSHLSKSKGKVDMLVQARTRSKLADTLVKLGRFDQAIREYGQARDIALSADDYSFGIKTRLTLGETLVQHGDVKQGCTELQRALTLQRQYDNAEMESRITAAQARHNCPAARA